MVTMWACATLLMIRLHPERIIHAMLAQLPYSSDTGSIYWLNRRTLVINDFKFGGFFYADQIVVTASPIGLWRHHIAKIQVYGGQLFTKPLYTALEKAGPGSGGGIDWVIGRLELSRGTAVLDDMVADTSIQVRLGVRRPIILTGLRLGKPDSSPEMSEERVLEIGQVNIVSPVDPVSPVLAFPLTKVRFTYTEIWHHQIRGIEMIRPTIYLGEDLFWLTKQFKAGQKQTTTQGPRAPWVVGHFEVNYGRLAVNAFGQPVLRFPFYFTTQVDNIRLDQLDQISAKSTIPFEKFSKYYPEYKVRVVDLTGNLYFSWPPSNANANNVYNRFKIKELAWNDIPVKDVDFNVTFDPDGVYGKLTNGTCEGGLLNGNFEFYYTKRFAWNADFFMNKVNCQPIAEKLIGKYASLTGALNGKLEVEGRSTEILHCGASLVLPNPGLLEIKSMDELLDRIPPDMLTIKRDAIKIAANAFKTYPYDYGKLNLNYNPTGGLSTLALDGPRGKREFDVAFHPWSLSKDDANNP